MAWYEDNLNTRLKYMSGHFNNTAEGRFQEGKLRGLKKALLYSYQAETAIFDDDSEGKMFRCLLNPVKLKADYDIKEISMPYQDICIGYKGVEEPFVPGEDTQAHLGEIPTNIAVGKTFEIQKDNTHWLIVNQFFEEDSYFRGEVYRCDTQVDDYWVYLRGPDETTIQWNLKHNINWNDLNYSMVMYITKDEYTMNTYHRFYEFDIPDPYIEDKVNRWRVAAVDPYYYEGIIQVMLQEAPNENDFNVKEEEKTETNGIIGLDVIYAFDTYTYTFDGSGGQWRISANMKDKIKVEDSTDNSITFTVVTGRSADFELRYILGDETYIKNITIDSL